MRPIGAAWTIVRVLATAAGVLRVARAARRRLPLTASASDVGPISVVIPARDEEGRIGPLLARVVGAPGVVEVLVVDDESSDATAAVATAAGATVVAGRPLPSGWVGKAWALQQGLDAAAGEWVVTLDADTRPDAELPRALAARTRDAGLDLLTVAGRFDCPTAPLRWLHPALLTTLLYRAPPPGAVAAGPVHRRMGNGQCTAFRRSTLVAVGGFGAVAHHVVEDVALVRSMAAAGFAVDFLDASSLLTVRMYETAADAWRGWGRSLSLPGVDGRWRRAGDVVVVAAAQLLPMARLVSRRADVLDGVALAARLGTLVGTRSAYLRRGPPYWLSPLADGAAVAALAAGLVRGRSPWRGRRY